MLSKVEERKSDLRNTTVLEVIIAVILILLLIIYYKDVSLKDEKTLANAKIEKLETQVSEQKKEIRELKKENRQLKRKLKFANDKIERLKKNLHAKTTGSQLEKVLRDQLEKEIDALNLRIADLEEKLASQVAITQPLKNQTQKLQKDYQDLRKKYQKTLKLLPKKSNPTGPGKGGKGYPRCQISGQKVHWLGKISKKGSNYQFILLPTGPTRKALLTKLPSLKLLSDKKQVTRDQFNSAGNKIYNWGLNQSMPCRFYVKINTKGMIIDDLKFLEKFFYKKLL